MSESFEFVRVFGRSVEEVVAEGCAYASRGVFGFHVGRSIQPAVLWIEMAVQDPAAPPLTPDQPIGDAIDGDFVMRDKPYSQDELRVELEAALKVAPVADLTKPQIALMQEILAAQGKATVVSSL